MPNGQGCFPNAQKEVASSMLRERILKRWRTKLNTVRFSCLCLLAHFAFALL